MASSYFERMKNQMDTLEVSPFEVPCKEVIEKENINLWKFPVTIHTALGPGPYIGTSFVTDPPPGTSPPSKLDLGPCEVHPRG